MRHKCCEKEGFRKTDTYHVGGVKAATMATHGGGLYCSTSNMTFESEEALREHYKSDWHRYNLKRKVAGLAPVTQEWFETRRAALQAASAPAAQVCLNSKIPGCWFN